LWDAEMFSPPAAPVYRIANESSGVDRKKPLSGTVTTSMPLPAYTSAAKRAKSLERIPNRGFGALRS